MPNIIIKNYEHYNRAMGKYISNKRQYDYEMKKGGYVSLDEGRQLAENHEKEKQWKPSEKCINVIQGIKNASKDGKIVLGNHPKIVKAMEDSGMTFKLPDWLPKHYQDKGGIVNE